MDSNVRNFVPLWTFEANEMDTRAIEMSAGFDDHFVHCRPMLSLQELALNQVISDMLYSVLSVSEHFKKRSPTNYKSLCYLRSHKLDAVSLIKDLRLPGCIEKMLRNRLKRICKELRRWIRHLLDEFYCDGRLPRGLLFRSNNFNSRSPWYNGLAELTKLFTDCLPIRDACLDLLRQRKFQECDRKLQVVFRFSYDYAACAQAFQQQLLEEVCKEKGIRVIFNDDEWDELNNDIDEVFKNNPSCALKMKQQVIKSMASKCRYNPRLRRGFDTMVSIVETIFKNDEELECVKRVFSDSFEASVQVLGYCWYEESCDEMLLWTFREWISK